MGVVEMDAEVERRISAAGTPPPDAVALGRSVTVPEGGPGRRRELAMVVPDAADPRRGRISIDSPLPQALLGRRAGGVVEARMPAGAIRLEVEAPASR